VRENYLNINFVEFREFILQKNKKNKNQPKMSTVFTTRLMFYLLGILLIATKLTAGRPQNTIDSQDSTDQQNNVSDLRRFYNGLNYQGTSSQISPEEQLALDRLNLQLLANYMQNSAPVGGWSDPLYRSPEMKRQVRYRQCYFNPISCFRK
jgi:hypothetical protein